MHFQMLLDSLSRALLATPHALRAFSASLAPLVVTGLWQGLALAAALALALRLAPRISAAHRFAIWAAGFSALAVLPFLPIFSRAAASGVVSSLPAVSAPAPSAWLQLGLNWSLAIAALWAAVSLWRAVDLAAHSLHLRNLWRTATPISSANSSADPQIASRIAALASLPVFDGRRAPEICTTTQLDRPSVIGFFAPRILIPHWLLGRLTAGELRQIVLHESEHLRRRDDWSNLLQKLCLVLFPLNPALWFVERRLCREREMACDEGVVRITRAPRAYAACLASLAERGLSRRAEALSLGAWQHRSELARRVHSLLLRRRTLSPAATRALLGVLGCGLLAGSVELARAPQLVAFVAARPATSARVNFIKALPAGANSAAIALAEIRPSAARTHFVSRALRAAAPRNVAALQPSSTPSAALRAALAPQANSLAETSARPVSTRSASATQLVASIAPAPHLGISQGRTPASSSAAPATPSPTTQSSTQEWIVFTTWQQIQTEPLRTNSSQSSSRTAQLAAEHTDKVLDSVPARRFTTRFTVTRVIFRVVPASSVPANAVALPMREGWLVLQL